MPLTLPNNTKPITHHYQFKQVASLGGTYNYSRAINEEGMVVGDSYLAGDIVQHAFYINPQDQAIDIGHAFAKMDSIAQGLNNTGLIVGHVAKHNQKRNKRIHQAFYFDRNKQVSKLIDAFGGDSSFAYDANDQQQVVGYAQTLTGTDEAFVYDVELDEISGLGTLGGLHSIAQAINEAGQIIGYSSVNVTDTHAFVVNNHRMHDIGTLGGASSFAYDINNHGLVVGSAYNQYGEDHAFIYDPNKRPCMQDLGTLGGAVSVANAINNHHQVVGYAFLENNSDVHAFLYHGGQMLDLNMLLDSASKEAGWILNEALDINDAGSITGIAYNDRLSLPGCAFVMDLDQTASHAYVRFLTHLGFKFMR